MPRHVEFKRTYFSLKQVLNLFNLLGHLYQMKTWKSLEFSSLQDLFATHFVAVHYK